MLKNVVHLFTTGLVTVQCECTTNLNCGQGMSTVTIVTHYQGPSARQISAISCQLHKLKEAGDSESYNYVYEK
jgi:hypothetical protein